MKRLLRAIPDSVLDAGYWTSAIVALALAWPAWVKLSVKNRPVLVSITPICGIVQTFTVTDGTWLSYSTVTNLTRRGFEYRQVCFTNHLAK